MDLLPAIDIRHGRVVRLSQGEPTRQTVYGDDPLATAEQFVAAGAQWIHVVDLDRALGQGENVATVRALVRQVGNRARVQLGGGYRELELVRSAVAMGAARVVVGTRAVLDRAFLPALVRELGAERVAVGVDVRDGYVALRGWTELSSRRADDLAREVVETGIGTLVYTDISRDGMLRGADVSGALALQASGAGVILSGGVAGTDDIRAACKAGLAGVIVGRALYEGRVSLPEGLAAARCAADR